MPLSVIQREIPMKSKPTNGREAYANLIESIHFEMYELKVILDALSEPQAKNRFIKEWKPSVGTVSFYD